MKTFPLSQTQMGIYITCANHTGSGNYNIDFLYHLANNIDLERLAQALNRVVEAHPYLKSRITTDETGEVVFEDHRSDPFAATIADITDIETIRPSLGRDFDLLHDQLFRIELYRTPKGNYLYLDFHHILFDGLSYNVFSEDLSKAYTGEPIEAEAVNGFDIALREQEARATARFEEDKAWFVQEFGGATEVATLPLPDIYDNEEEHFARLYRKIDIDREAVAGLCQQAGVTEGVLFTTAFGLSLATFVGEEQSLFTTVFHGRNNKDERRALTMMVKTLPVFLQFDPSATVAELLQKASSQIRLARQHNLYSFGELHTDYGVTSDVTFSYMGTLRSGDLVLEGQKVEKEDLTTNTPGIKMLSEVIVSDGDYYALCEYQTNKYSQTLIEEMWETFRHIVAEMCVKELLGDITLCSPRQLAALDSYNHTGLALPESGETVLNAFKKMAGLYPDNVAAVFKDKRYTYRQLDEITDRVGGGIFDLVKACGKEEPVVSILIGRGENMFILPLAAMKAGCAYQPLDPSYPQERLNFMVKDAGAALLIADPDKRDLVNEYGGPTLLTDQLADIAPGQPLCPRPLTPKSLFILLYTSGSTGVPKGVMLEHGNLIAFCNWYRNYYGLKPEHQLAAYASFGFDACMMDTYTSLTTGSTSHIIPEEMRLDLTALNDYFEQNHITHAFFTTQVGVQFVENTDNHSLLHLSVGGEKLVSLTPPTRYTLHNGYGPTECTIFSTIFPTLAREHNIPIGKPVGTLKCQVVDKTLRRLPTGAPGELIIIGNQVARGYLGQPEKTAEAFFTINGERAYHSGDIVRYRPDGNIEFVGRKDGQVKIHGFRIELKEVEGVIRQFEGVTDVTVQAFDDPNGGKFIAAYIVGNSPIDTDKLNAFILEQKPPYMVPAVTMQIEKIPLNVNQKVDKKALPKPQITPRSTEATAAAPLNALEEELHELVAGIVNTREFGITDPLGYIGLTSITSIKLATLIYKRYGVQVDARSLSKTGTLQSIENQILQRWLAPAGEEQPQAEPSKPVPATQKAPLSATQKGVYTECVMHADSTLYNIPMCVSFPRNIEAGQLEAVLRQVVDSHPILKCRFLDDGEVVQTPIEGFRLAVPHSSQSEADFSGYRQQFVQPFDLAAGPLIRTEIVTTPEHTYLLMDIHHLVCDGYSYDLIVRQLCETLDGKKVEAEQYTYFDFVADEQITPETEAFFSQRMGAIEQSTQLIPDIFEAGLPHTQGAAAIATDFASVQDYASRHGITPAALYLAAAYIAVGRYVCEDDINLCTISNGRSNLKVSDTVGMFVNTLVLSSSINKEQTCADFVLRTAEEFAATLSHENYPFAQIAAKYDYKPNISFAYQVGVIEPHAVSTGAVETQPLELNLAKIPVNVVIDGTPEECLIRVEYDQSLYSEPMMQQFALSVNNIVAGLVRCEKVGQISLTNEKQWDELDQYNAVMDLRFNHGDTVVSVIRRITDLAPQHPALVYKDLTLTYSQVDSITNRLARCIREQVKPQLDYLQQHPVEDQDGTKLADVVVSILIHRNEWMVLASLAALKAGCGYQPLDPSYPQDRLNFMVKDAQASLLIADDDLCGVLTDYRGETICTSQIPNLIANLPDTPIDHSRTDGLVTLLYTSGSTGVPKGCMLEHRNLVAFGYADKLTLDLSPKSRVGAYASFGFDVNMMDMYCTLMNGGTMYIIPEDMRMNLEQLHDYIESEGITQIFLTTQVGVQYLENYPQSKSLRRLAMGGEKLRAVSPENLSYHIFNGYGPSEMTCGVSMFTIEHWEPNIPIGKPMHTLQGYVVDKTGHRLPVGAAGELWITGPQVARGYLGRPDKTAEAFSSNPFIDRARVSDEGDRRQCGRIYHSGDIVRYRADGNIEFVGRKDGQVKIRGFRIELTEVESVIRAFDGVKEVTVQTYDYDDGGKYIAAFVVMEPGMALDTDRLNAFIKSQKPPYMVPAVSMQIDSIPLTVNQKVDKKALPKPVAQKTGYVAPRNKAEEDFCRIFSEVTGIEKVGAEDDFFDIGGSSILALKVVIAAGKSGYSIVYNDVFTYTTPAALAELAGGSTTDEPQSAPEASSPCGGTAADIPTIDADGFDHTAINTLLQGNTLQAFLSGERQPIGDVLLTGGTGFLGVHVLHELITHYTGHITCLVRSGHGQTGEERLRETLRNYFSEEFDDSFDTRITVAEGDATDPATFQALTQTLGGEDLTVVNCAACVKHFAKGNEIELINVESVRNIIDWCLTSSARLVHVSTESVFGDTVGSLPPSGFVFNEQVFYAGQQYSSNQYIHSKYTAERMVYDAIVRRDLNAKVMRVGNLAPRFEDGKFQTNYKTNNMVNLFAAYCHLGMIPFDIMDAPMEFSPINYVARAILLLASTPKENVCFMPSNQHRQIVGDIVMTTAQQIGREVRMADSEEFGSAVAAALANPGQADRMRPLMAYAGRPSDTETHNNGLEFFSVAQTVQTLYRLGFRWPETSSSYVARFVEQLKQLGFYDE